MHRFYYDNELCEGKVFELSSEESHHALRVLRLQVGDAIEVLNGKYIFEATIQATSKKRVTCLCGKAKPSVAPKTKITLYQGFPKGDKFFSILQKCTEVGVHAVVPVLFERSVKKGNQADKILDKGKKQIIEACKQCGLNEVPTLHPFVTMENLAPLLLKHDLVLVPWECENEHSLNQAIKNEHLGKSIGVIVGPEGGIDPSEIEQLMAISAKPISLGQRILRTETAGVCTVFSILMQLNDL